MTSRVISLSCRPAETVHLWWHEGLAGVRAELSMRLIQEQQVLTSRAQLRLSIGVLRSLFVY